MYDRESGSEPGKTVPTPARLARFVPSPDAPPRPRTILLVEESAMVRKIMALVNEIVSAPEELRRREGTF
jgi:hypothetical protein